MLALDIQEAAKGSRDPTLAQKAVDHATGLTSKGIAHAFASTLQGGDAVAGRKVVFGHPAAQCIRCHKVAGLGSDIGPDLSKVATRLSREAILEALVDPQARLTEGYGLLVGKLKDGRDVSGAIVKATDEHYEIKSADGKVSRVSRKELASVTLTSQMPPAGAILRPSEIRDVIEFLGRLK